MTKEERQIKAVARREKVLDRRTKLAVRGLVLTDSTVHYQGTGGPLAGCRATVETAGDLDRRITATRLILTGPFAFGLRKKKDHRELYLAVEGDGFAFVAKVNPQLGLVARQVAARINTRSMQMAREFAPRTAAPAPLRARSKRDAMGTC